MDRHQQRSGQGGILVGMVVVLIGGVVLHLDWGSYLEPVVGSPLEPLLVELGFRAGPRKLTLST
jgi:hypothetical protein